jgi:uncharacterized protein involved in high-affinity Fe2+ transport
VAYRTLWMRHLQTLSTVVMLLAIVGALMVSSCAGDGELDDSITGDDTSSVNNLPNSFSEVLLMEEEIANGAVLAVIEVAQPDQIETTSVPSIPKDDAQLHFETQLRYTGPMLGGRVEGEFVPYLMVNLAIVNDVTGERLDTRLRPHMGVAEGWHYAANIVLPGDSPTYSTTVIIEGPLPFDGMAPGESVDGTIVTRHDLTPSLPGSLLDFASTTQLHTTIRLADIIAARIDDDDDGDDDDNGDQPSPPPPPPDPYAG